MKINDYFRVIELHYKYDQFLVLANFRQSSSKPLMSL